MVKYISSRITKNDAQMNEAIILTGVKRNFGGTNLDTAIRSLEQSDI
jgi:hypothetical protein